MPRPLLVLAALPLALFACSSDAPTASSNSAPAAGGGAHTIEVTLSDAGCEPRSISTTAGPTTFEVTNDGSAAVTEFEILQDGKILGEVENVIPGAERSFSLTLKAGSYTTECPGGSSFDEGTLEVAAAASGSAAGQADRDAAVANYLTYVKGEADQLVVAVAPFAAAVKAGDIARGQQLFASARAHYETIEPIAESFGDLDPAVDAREGDVPDEEWGGFHRIEKALWVDADLSAMAPVADKLVADVARLRTQIDGVELEPATIANGAVELLNEMSTSKITGEEDRYSHTDLSDFAANLSGSKAAFEAVAPLLDAQQSALRAELERRFDDVRTALDKHQSNDPVGNGYALFTTLTPDDTRLVSSALDALAEPLSKVAAAVLVA